MDAPITSQKPSVWLLGKAQPARVWILLSVAAGFTGGLLLIFQARLLARIIHGAFIDGLSQADLGALFLTLVGIVVLRAGLAWGKETSGFHAGARVRQELRTALMRHTGDLGPLSTEGAHSGALSACLAEEVEALQAVFAYYLPQLALAVSIPIAIAAFVFPISWAAGGLLLLTAPLIRLFMILVGMGAEAVSQRHFQTLARMSAQFLDTLQGLPTLKLLNQSRSEAENIAAASDAYRQRTMQVLRIAFLSTAVLELFSSLSIALVAVYLGSTYLGFTHFGMYGQTLTLAQGLFILLLAPDFYLPLRELGTHYHARAEALGAAEEILKVLSRRPVNVFTGGHSLEASQALTIELDNVYFGYAPGTPTVLAGVSLRLSPGEQVVLVGPSGAGKTTLLNLLLGFIAPDRGDIRINARPLSELTPESWRRAIGWLGQKPVLFQDTIAGNIAMGKPGAGREEIETAALSARVVDFARHLPDGLDTRVGEQGWGLSRGQAQRVALARVFLKNAPILLLDEPAAGLDMENERMVMHAIDRFSKDRTVLMLTHRLGHLKSARQIAVLAGGRIAEQGSYAQLAHRTGPFSRLAGLGDRRATS